MKKVQIKVKININQNIAKNIENYMKVLDINQVELARRLECSPSTVNMWLKGNSTPRLDKIDQMCRIFGCERKDLLAEEPKTNDEILSDQIISEFAKEFRDLSHEKQLRLLAYMRALQREEQNHAKI